MRNMALFIIKLIRKSLNDDIFELSGGLTYRMLLAFFPFIVFFMSLLGFVNLDDSVMLERLYGVLPEAVNSLIGRFIAEVYHTRSKGLLSTSLFFSVYNTTNGFRAVIRSINKAYDYKDNRNIVKATGLSFILMLMFTISIIVMLVLLIFGDYIFDWLRPSMPDTVELLYAMLSALASMVVLALATMMIYKLASARKVSMMNVLPGAVFTVLLWVVSSKLFSYFITHYSQYSVLYGSIAGVFILILWLNLISLILLVGNEINSMLIVE